MAKSNSLQLLHGDCFERMRELPSSSVDAIVTDPPYGLSFMGKKWDYDVPSEDVWRECLRVLKPGGHLLAFAGTRTQHRMAVRIEDAGFEIRDMIAWVYGSGFPKSLNIGKAVDKLQGNEREVIGQSRNGSNLLMGGISGTTTGTVQDVTKGTSPWEGWGTALKPALEPITVARKPLSEKTVAENVLTHGTGGLNIDGCRVSLSDGDDTKRTTSGHIEKNYGIENQANRDLGRFPANLIHDGSEEVVRLFPQTKSGARKSGQGSNGNGGAVAFRNGVNLNYFEGDSGSAARFFYCAKASKKDRDEGLDVFKEKTAGERTNRKEGSAGINAYAGATGSAKNHHPTVKPTDLMRYLCRLVTPPGGVVLDPFMGSGSTGKAAILEGFSFIGIEKEDDYLQIAKGRIDAAMSTIIPSLYENGED